MLKNKGYDVRWEKALYCPYRAGPSPQDHDITCTQCNNGFIYFDPIETRMMCQSITLDENYYAYGRYDTGKQMITAYPEHKLNFWDRITAIESIAEFKQLLLRQPGTSLRDRPKYDALEVVMLQWVDRTRALKTFTAPTDFDVDSVTGEIVWKGANRPDDNSYYTVLYKYHPQYLVIDLPHHIRDSRVLSPTGEDKQWEFPVQAVAQLSYMIRDENRDPRSEDNRKNPFPSHEGRWQGP